MVLQNLTLVCSRENWHPLFIDAGYSSCGSLILGREQHTSPTNRIYSGIYLRTPLLRHFLVKIMAFTSAFDTNTRCCRHNLLRLYFYRGFPAHLPLFQALYLRVAFTGLPPRLTYMVCPPTSKILFSAVSLHCGAASHDARTGGLSFTSLPPKMERPFELW